MKSTLRLLVFLCSISGLSAQTITLSGKITDTKGDPIPFASVFQKNSTTGTSANISGDYSLSLTKGVHDIVFQALNFKQEIKHLDLQASQTANVTLADDVYELQSVSISSNGEDPAYRIIRNAIKARKEHLQEVKAYTCEVYIKGLQRILGAPKKFLGKDIDKIAREGGLDSNRTGIVYLSESQSKFSFRAPNDIHEEVIASKVSGSNRAFSFNRASNMKLNLYENLSDWEDLSNRPMVSPIADNALFYYTYKLLGTTQENGETVHKIQVTPRRESDPVFRGTIYIMEDSWRIHSAGLFLTKNSGIKFVDTLNINQRFFPAGGKVWMPASINFDFTGGVLAFRIGGYFAAVYKNYDLKPVQNNKSFDEVLRMTREVNKKDSSYWQQNRPIPLTAEEVTDYDKKGKLAVKRESKPYLDSLDRVNNKFKVRSFLTTGLTVNNRYKKEYFRFNPLLGSLFYNTVEGFGINYAASFVKLTDSLQNRRLEFGGKIRYGFSNEKAHILLHSVIPVNTARLTIVAGSDVVDLNNLGTLSTLGNSFNSLLFERNRQKLYEKRFGSIGITQRVGSVTTSLSAEWANRKWLPNSSDYRISDSKDRAYTSNNPFFPSANVQLFPENQSLKIDASVSYAFSKKYVTYPWGKYYVPSKFPRLTIGYTKGIKNVFGSDVDYDLLYTSITKSDISLGLYGKTSFYLGAGKFLNNNKLYYVDYKHFVGTQTLVYQPKPNTFLFQDYYLYSTKDEYFEAHLEHNFSGFLFNKLPLIRKLKLQEIIGTNYMSTPALKNYAEFYGGIQYLGFRGVYGVSYNNGEQIHSAIRIKYGISL